MERRSQRPFGYLTHKRKFIRQDQKIPFYNVPDLSDFTVLIHFFFNFHS